MSAAEVPEKKMMFDYYTTLVGTQNSSENLDGFTCDRLDDIKLELVSKNSLFPLPGNASFVSECSQSEEGSVAESQSSGGGKMKSSKLNSKLLKDDKTCAVCGDKALGCNFDAISCESCKAFFRRNANKESQMKCLFDGQCKIDINTRRFCPYCRLKKCLSAGMKKHLILDVDEKKRRMEKVVKNREKRIGNCLDAMSSSGPSSVDCVSPPPTPGPLSSCQNFPSPHNTFQPEMTNLLTLSRLISSGESSFSSLPTATVDSLLLRRLTAEETHMLHELNQVYDLSFTVDLEPLIHIKQLNPSLNQLVNQSSITVLRLIKFAKRLEEFVRLSQECQISILKGCWMHMLLLRSVSLYDCDRDVWVTPRGDIPTEILKNATGYVQLHDDHIQYCKSIKSIIGNDLTIVVILLALVLFAPEGTHIVMRDLVSNIQDRYLVLLKHYLEAKYTYLRTAEMFPQLLNKIHELNTLAKVHGKILLEINPEEIEPIMLEILDLK